MRHWLTKPKGDPAEFARRAEELSELYREAPILATGGIQVVCVDEKTGMVARERAHPTLPMRPGLPERREFEYERHGALCLTANLAVATGKILSPTLAEKRDNDDFLAHIRRTVALAPRAGWIFILDNLNTHTSEALVHYAAEQNGFTRDLGRLYDRGILRNQGTRAVFLSTPTHRVRFVFTPKHCSWLNQVEIFFSVMARRLLRRGSFTSLDDLKQRVLAFIQHYNAHWARPYRWTYTGRPLDARVERPCLPNGRRGHVMDLLAAKLRTSETLH